MCVGPAPKTVPANANGAKAGCGPLAEHIAAGLSEELLMGLRADATSRTTMDRRERAWKLLAETRDALKVAAAISPLRLQWALGRCLGLRHAMTVLEAHELASASEMSEEVEQAYKELGVAIDACQDQAQQLFRELPTKSPQSRSSSLLAAFLSGCAAGLPMLLAGKQKAKALGQAQPDTLLGA